MCKFFVLLFSLAILSQLAFAGRYYDSKVGRFLQIDPKAQKYPGLSTYAYVADNPLRNIDPDGKDIIVLNAPKGASGFGHAAVLIGNSKTGYTYYSKDGTSHGLFGPADKNYRNGDHFESLSDFANQVNPKRGEKPYTGAYEIKSDEKTDAAMNEAAKKTSEENYAVVGNSCIDVPSDALQAGGFNPGYEIVTDPMTGDPMFIVPPDPNSRYTLIEANNQGQDVSSQIQNNQSTQNQTNSNDNQKDEDENEE
jgi:uncharacterized protein RhaS with RHS repeats